MQRITQFETSPHPVFPFRRACKTGGSRLGLFPYWLSDHCNDRRIHLATFDYRLIPTCTISELRNDLLDAYRWVNSGGAGQELRSKGHNDVDVQKLMIMGSSAGGYCAVLLTEAVLANPDLHKPVALMTLYGELNIGSSFYNRLKTASERVGRSGPQLSLRDLQHLFVQRAPLVGTNPSYFTKDRAQMVSPEEQLEYDQTHLTNTIMNEGITSDVLFGISGLSEKLSVMALSADTSIDEQRRRIPTDTQPWFPLLHITPDFPRTLVFHGVEDTAIPIQDSEVFASELQRAGVEHRFVRVEGAGSEHGFDRANVQHWWLAYLSKNVAWLLQGIE